MRADFQITSSTCWADIGWRSRRRSKVQKVNVRSGFWVMHEPSVGRFCGGRNGVAKFLHSIKFHGDIWTARTIRPGILLRHSEWIWLKIQQSVLCLRFGSHSEVCCWLRSHWMPSSFPRSLLGPVSLHFAPTSCSVRV